MTGNQSIKTLPTWLTILQRQIEGHAHVMAIENSDGEKKRISSMENRAFMTVENCHITPIWVANILTNDA